MSTLAVHAIRDDAAERRQDEDGNLPGEADDAKERHRVRQPVDEPGLRNHLHPCADERDELPGDEQAIVARSERAKRRRKRHPLQRCYPMAPRHRVLIFA